jgi:predicted signal transduction protein with EAL and GGDEF domain
MHDRLPLENASTSKRRLNFLNSWLVNHILGMDQKMARQLTAIKNGSTAAQALEAEKIEIDGPTKALLTALNQTLEMKIAQRTQALQKANEDLEQLAVTDMLTNLPNRRYAMLHLSTLWEEAQQQNIPFHV